MHTFTIVRRQRDWAVQLGQAMTAPCKSRAAAIEQAERMAEAIRRHGETVAVVIDLSAVSSETDYLARPPKAAAHAWASRRELRAR